MTSRRPLAVREDETEDVAGRATHRARAGDLSAYAVRRAVEEARRGGVSAEFRVGDMRSPPPGPFDGACCLGNSINYLSHEDLRAFLRGMHAAVRPGARWVVDSGTAAESLLPKFAANVRTLEAAGIHFEVRQRYDPVEGSYGVYTVAELRRLFLEAGWSVLGLHGALDGRPFALGDPRLLIVAERPASAEETGGGAGPRGGVPFREVP